MADPKPELRLLAINLTRRCNLACAHCYLDAEAKQGAELNRGRSHFPEPQPVDRKEVPQKKGSESFSPELPGSRFAAALENDSDPCFAALTGELTTAEVCGLLDEAKDCGDGAMVVLTGGEPLLRRDLEAIIAHGARCGLAMVVGTNGTLLTARRVASLKEAGLLGVGISVDSLDAGRHDRFRGKPGAWAKTLAGIEHCRRQGLSFQIHFSVTADNADELPAVIDFARASDARVLNVFFLICTGRGEALSDISPQRYEQILAELIEAQARYPDLIIRPRCAPQFKRIAHQLDPAAALNRISGREADGCIAGSHYCRVTPAGAVTACPYIPDEVGSIRTQSFRDIWARAADFERLRHGDLQGNCGACEYRKLCGGCRARPVAAGGDLLDADPWCGYRPRGGAVIEPLGAEEKGSESFSSTATSRSQGGSGENDSDPFFVTWSAAAQARLERVPGFLRKLVRQRAEVYVAELGETEVTPEHLAILSARRFGGRPPSRPRP